MKLLRPFHLIACLFMVAFVPMTSFAQEFSLPISDQDAFLSEARPFIESITIGQLFPLKKEGKVRPGAGFRVGYAERKINFDNDMIFANQNGDLVMNVNDDPTLDYENRFLRRGLTRLRGEYIRVGGSFGLLLGKMLHLSTGMNADFRIRSVYHNRYFVGDDRMREKLTGNDLLQLNNTQFSWVTQFGFQGLSVSYEISLNPFFADAWGLDYQFQSFGIVYGF